MFNALAIGGASAVLLAAPLSASGHTPGGWGTPPPDKIVIDLVTVNGSGCPAGTAAVAVSPDNTAFTVTYSTYLAQVGKGSSPTDLRKNCQLALNVHVPQGFTYAIASADYRGFAHLEKGATAQERANYYFQGMSQTASATHAFKGPLFDDWQTNDTTDVSALVYKPCGEERYLNINTELRAGAGTSDTVNTTSFISMDSTDASINTIYHFSWKVCPPK
ncbi:DUF4360 domain-containing protein [Streptomyces sp. NPDC023838]|uniref:DUF4360 domain-containing protein n=1 Tax=Streptomyces sp. NPDC023838 TaxID=3154325 RepID=UPI00340FB3B6